MGRLAPNNVLLGRMKSPRMENLLAGSRIELPSAGAEKVLRFLELLTKWNERVSLTSSTRAALLGPLVRESIWAALRYPVDFRVHLDIGSGAGFPAIPLAIVRADVEVTMVESRERKAAFLQTAAHELSLANVRVANQRLDEFLRGFPEPGPWNCISWKAVRLSAQDLSRLLETTAQDSRFWIFHGRNLPVEDPSSLETHLILNRRDECPFHAGWFLSEFRRRTVSRETS
jgi:16S rRNA (guanine(527)-N(7))-methyltransferase RsmG